MRLSAIGEAAAWISHELKNSLMLLKSFVYLFPEEHADEKFADRFGRLVPSEVSRWERMLNELSGLSTPHELKIARVDIAGRVVRAWLLDERADVEADAPIGAGFDIAVGCRWTTRGDAECDDAAILGEFAGQNAKLIVTRTGDIDTLDEEEGAEGGGE